MCCGATPKTSTPHPKRWRATTTPPTAAIVVQSLRSNREGMPVSDSATAVMTPTLGPVRHICLAVQMGRWSLPVSRTDPMQQVMNDLVLEAVGHRAAHPHTAHPTLVFQ